MASEKRLIDANALAKKMKAHHDFYIEAWGGFKNLPPDTKARVDEISACWAEVYNEPTVDAVEVVHGEWDAQREIKRYRGENIPVIQCSECKCYFCDIINNHHYMYHYCPNCGAKMDGERKYNERKAD